ncbi:lysophospholipase-like protein 1 [Macrosteles quadrilineatus]|uniref:lysophospholipase-like protein 1 n=1 Tax=Macrosteles quadrilineatus TaxID=74068 RepID=UPI0023E33388|nr:lysophospholipase-like protein 1 [Macrosteles quadrilineatus]
MGLWCVVTMQVAHVPQAARFLNKYLVTCPGKVDLKTKQTSGGETVQLPPLFMCHGERDDLVKMEWVEETFNTLTNLGVTAEFHRFPNMLHELKKKELEMLYGWIKNRVKYEGI